MRKILPYIIVLSLFINFCFSDSFFKTEEGCEFWTSHTDAQKLTWDGACKNGRVDGKGKLIIYKNNEIFYEYNGRVINGYPKNGTIEWTDGRYADYVWLNDDPANQKAIGVYKNNGETIIGETVGFDRMHLVYIYSDESYRSGIIENNTWIELKSIKEIENYFRKNYSKSEYEHFVPINVSKTIAITNFDNNSKDSSYDPLIKGLADMLISDLSTIKSLKIVEREKLDAVLQEINLGKSEFIDNKTAQEMGKGLGAQYILTGSFMIIDEAFRVDARLIDVENGEIVFSKSSEGNKDTFFDIEKDLANTIISSLELNVNETILNAMEESGTRSYDAYYDFVDADNFGVDCMGSIDKCDSAIVYYNKSLINDPSFQRAINGKFAAYTFKIYHMYPDIMYNDGYLEGTPEDNQEIIDYFNYCNILYTQGKVSGDFTEHLKVAMNHLYPKISNGYYAVFHDTLKALEITLDGINEFPSNYRLWYDYGFINYCLKDFNNSLIAFDKTLELVPNDISSLRNIGVIMQDLENWERVIKINKMRLEIEPNNYYVFRNLAFAYMSQGEYSDAIDYFIKVSKMGGGISESFTNIGINYVHMGQYIEAIDYFEQAISKIESYGPEGSHGTSKSQIEQSLLPVIYDYLALSYEKINAYEKSIEITKKRIDMIENPRELSESYTRLGFCYSEMKNTNKAKKYYEKAIKEDPDYWNAYNNYAYFYLEEGEIKLAEAMFKENIQREPSNPWVYHSMGEFYQKLEEYEKAIEYFDSSIERDSTYAVSYYSLGEIYEKMNNKLFFTYYRMAADLNNEDAKRWIKKNQEQINQHNDKSKKPSGKDYIEELKKLAELRDLGIITDEEFEAKKKELLGL